MTTPPLREAAPDVSAPASPAKSPWSPLRHSTFRAIWIATIAANVGTWMQDVGNVWLMTSLSPSPFLISLVQAATSLPMFLLALPAGALADILDRRRLLIFAQMWMLSAVAAIAILTLFGLTSVPTLLFFATLIGVGAALEAPAWQSIVSELVPPGDVPAAIALDGVAINISRAIGPALGGLVIAAAGPATAFALNAISFFAVAVVLYRWRREYTPPTLPAERMAAAVRAGARYVLHAGPIRAVLARTAAFMLGASGLWALIPVVVRGEMKLGPAGYGLLLGCLGAGAFAAVTFLPRARKYLSPDVLVVVATILFAVAELSLAHFRRATILAPFLFLGGIGWVTVLSSLNVAAQRAVPGWVRSRALSAYILVWFGAVAIGSVVWGGIASHWSTGVGLAASAVVLLLGLPVAIRFRLCFAAGLDLSPSQHWPVPNVASEPEPDRGPVMVLVEYRVREGAVQAFMDAMRPLRSERLRDGAASWGLYADASDPSLFVETFTVESWIEHLRQHARVTNTDREAQVRLNAFLKDGYAPSVRHLIYSLRAVAHHLDIENAPG